MKLIVTVAVTAVIVLAGFAGGASAGTVPPGGVPCSDPFQQVCVFTVDTGSLIRPRYRCVRAWVPGGPWWCQRFGATFGGPVLAWSPSTSGSFDFGTVDAGQTASQTFILTNSGARARALTIAISGSTAFTKTVGSCTGTSLGAGKSCSVTVEYAPTAVGQTDAATLIATGTKPLTSASLALAGASTAGTPNLHISPGIATGSNSYQYTLGGGNTLLQMFTVTNDGNGTTAALTLSVTAQPGGSWDFGNDTCTGQTLALAGTCTFAVAFIVRPGCVQPFFNLIIDATNVVLADLQVFGACP